MIDVSFVRPNLLVTTVFVDELLSLFVVVAVVVLLLLLLLLFR
jgi:hypothetical protein